MHAYTDIHINNNKNMATFYTQITTEHRSLTHACIPTPKRTTHTHHQIHEQQQQTSKSWVNMQQADAAPSRLYRSTAATVSSEAPTHPVHVPPLRPRGLSLPPPPWLRPPPRFPSVTSMRLVTQRTTTRSSVHRGRARLIFRQTGRRMSWRAACVGERFLPIPR